jgi:hypothetical protein
VQAVIIVGTFEFLGPLLGGTAVANTIGKFVTLGDVQAVLSLAILISGLMGAIAWNLATWYFGIPSSSSHALVGRVDRRGGRFGRRRQCGLGLLANDARAIDRYHEGAWPAWFCRQSSASGRVS